MISLKINLDRKHEISPYLYMQFMEPLGTADSSIDAAWDFVENDWHPLVIEKVRELAPTMIRFGGTMIDYYHWKEAVGPKRIPMINHCWGGVFMNQVGTHEVVDFCRKVNAEPLMVVNMESDGFANRAYPKNDTIRIGTAEEAAEWVNYCNNANNVLRRTHGITDPYHIKYWQIGNETSYKGRFQTGFNLDACYEVTSRFAAAMRKEDTDLKLIGWGDDSYDGEKWVKKMSGVEGIDILAFHHHFDSGLPDSPLYGTRYQCDIEKTWHHLMNAYKSLDEHICQLRADCGSKRLAMTEGHYTLPGRNRCEVLSTWGAGVSYARCLNVIMRHSDILDIATMADFFGNVWQVNALMLPAPIPYYGMPYLQPVGAVMSLFGHHQGKYAMDCTYNGDIDAVVSATDNKIFIHIANTDMKQSKEVRLELSGRQIAHTIMYYIAENPATEITPVNVDVFAVKTQEIEGDMVILPPAAVAAIEVEIL